MDGTGGGVVQRTSGVKVNGKPSLSHTIERLKDKLGCVNGDVVIPSSSQNVIMFIIINR